MLEPRMLSEIVRTARIEYPIPYLSVVLGAIGVTCLTLTAFIHATAAAVATVLGGLAGLAAISLPVWAALSRPDLLRSERHSLMSRAFDVMLDKDASREARSKAGEIVEATLLADASGPRVPRPRIETRKTPTPEVEDE
jgi:hypothetical protein